MAAGEDREHPERLLRRAEAVLRAVSEQSSDGVLVQERGRIGFVNPAMNLMFGYGDGELLGHHIEELVAHEARSAVLQIMMERDPITFYTHGLRKNGTTFRAEVHACSAPYDGGVARVGVIRDLTEQDEAETASAESVSFLLATLDATADGMLLVNLSGRIVFYNEQFRKIWRLPEDVLRTGDDFAALTLAEEQILDPRVFRARLRELWEKPELESTDLIHCVDGRIIERYSRPQYVGKSIMGRVWSFRDVTAQRRAERALQLAVEMRDEFIGIASHELFTPITSLTVALRGLRGGVEASDAVTHERLLRTAERQVERLTRLVQELLDVGRIDGGQLAITREELDLREVVHDTLERFAAEIERDGIEVKLLAPDPVVGRWDRVRLEQVSTNLLSNAIKFGRGRPIEVSVCVAGERASLAVRDQGVGIPLDRQALIFERFQRAVSARHYAGLGLGLYITRQLVEAHGGTLRVESKPGQGATFIVELPHGEVVA